MKKYGEQAGLFCMNRGWKFIEQDFSVLPKGRNHDDIYSYAKGGAQKGPAEEGFDDSAWENVELPHDWVARKSAVETGSPNQGYKERGIGWYRMRFGLEEEDRKKQILLEFEGMSAEAQIYINGMLMKRSYSGYNSFTVDMTDMAHFGVLPNTIAVRIDASAWEGWWYEGAGIYRNVWLVKKSALHVGYQGIYILPEKNGEDNWKVNITAELENSFEYTKKAVIRHVILDESGNIVASAEAQATVQGFARRQVETGVAVHTPKLWDVEQPHLYRVETVLGYDGGEQDDQIHSFGFRTIELCADTGFWLNGRNIKLKGFCCHQDHAGVGVAVPYNVKEYRVRKLLELGANAYRCAHNPDPEILEICDRLGMMVMEENRTFSSAADNLEEVKGIVKNARNHPSVILYSVFNEEPLQGTGKGRRMAGRLQAAVKEMDTTRPVLGAFNGGYLDDEGAATILDVVGINYNPQRYDDFHAKYPGTPLLGSETASAFMVRGEYETDKMYNIIDDYDSECAPWGTTVRDTWRYVNERAFVAGSFVWTGFDYRGEPTPFEWPSVATFFGTYDSCGFEKDACYLYKAFWTEEPMVHIASPWCDRRSTGKEIKAQVYSNCDWVQLYVNGELAKEQAVDPYEQTTFTLSCEEGELRAVGIRNGRKAAEDVQRTAGAARTLHIEPVCPELKSGGMDTVIVNLTVTDGEETVLPDFDGRIHFTVENGHILGVGNGNPNSHEPDVAAYCRAFHGRAQAIIKPDGNENVPTETVLIHAELENGIKADLAIPVKSVEEIPYIQPLDEQIVNGWRLYHKITKERPDPDLKTRHNDMNSFEPVTFSGHMLPELANKPGCYAMYRTSYDLQDKGQERRLHFCYIEGYVWIYINGQIVEERTDRFGGDMTIDIPAEITGVQEITVIVQNANEEYPQAGITSPVFFQKGGAGTEGAACEL